jgi:hypothetical protein
MPMRVNDNWAATIGIMYRDAAAELRLFVKYWREEGFSDDNIRADLLMARVPLVMVRAALLKDTAND